MFSLTDDQLAEVTRAAALLPPRARAEFLRLIGQLGDNPSDAELAAAIRSGLDRALFPALAERGCEC
jgi:hypothetical protein